MEYIELHLQITPINNLVNDILAAELGEYGFESFIECEDGMLAYIPSKIYNKLDSCELIPRQLFGSVIEVTLKTVPDQNWNEEWEKNYFKPIVIGQECVIHSSFHKEIPFATYDILIDPKMAFGTGHHETTSLMLSELINLDLKDKSFLDMGCGTAVLAILASLKGADPILGIDIDEWAVQNAQENIRLNKTQNIQIQLGGAELLVEKNDFDIIFANINRNILLQDMEIYITKMHSGSLLYMSGFYESDIQVIREKAESFGLIYQGFVAKNNWVAVHFEKP